MPAPDFLIFQLYGNLASWGDIAVGGHRPIDSYPSKSAIMGLLAASLGIDREQDAPHIALNKHYGIAVCVHAQGELLRDYHTTQVPKGNKNWATRKDELSFDQSAIRTILSQRDYQMDAYYLIALWQKDLESTPPYRLKELKNALKQPIFVTSLGRKSCPPCLPYHPEIMNQTTLKNAFQAYEVDVDIQRYFNKEDLISYYWEDGLDKNRLGMEHSMSYPRRDQLRSRQRWQFSSRKEYYYAEQRQGES